MWFLALGYYQLMWSRKTDVIGSCDLYYRAATIMANQPPEIILSSRWQSSKIKFSGCPVTTPSGQSIQISEWQHIYGKRTIVLADQLALPAISGHCEVGHLYALFTEFKNVNRFWNTKATGFLN